MVKNGNKTEKCYVCLFTCSTTRNVNMEIVDDMTADQFLFAFKRHCAVYGTPSLILCDNAKTFQKADEEIQKLFQVIEVQTVQHHFAQKRFNMRHIPAKSPHWGGMYERLIGVVKMSIKKVLRPALISLPELQTLIKKVQAVVAFNADVLRLVTRSSLRTSAQRTGHFRSLAVSLCFKRTNPLFC